MAAVQAITILLRIIAEGPNPNDPQWAKSPINRSRISRTATTTAAAQTQKKLNFMEAILMSQNVRSSGGLFEAIRWMEERIGTSLDLVGKGDPEAIAIMERNLLKETLKARTKMISSKGSPAGDD